MFHVKNKNIKYVKRDYDLRFIHVAIFGFKNVFKYNRKLLKEKFL